MKEDLNPAQEKRIMVTKNKNQIKKKAKSK